jgi:hypothetical protein
MDEFQFSSQNIADLSDMPILWGKPLHKHDDFLIHELKNSSDINLFLRNESQKSIGDYCLIFPKNEYLHIITSTGFSGAYYHSNDDDFIISKELKPAIQHEKHLSLKEDYLLYFLTCKHSRFTTHLTSVFNNIKVLGPSQYLKCKLNCPQDIDVRIYQKDYDVPPVASFFDVISEVIYRIVSNHRDVSLMLSGGIDSLILGIILEECGIEPKTFTYWRSASGDNNPFKAQTFAKHLKWKNKVIAEEKFLPSGKVSEHIFGLMQKDFINPKNPHWGETPYSSKFTLHGQNADAMAVLSISKRKVFDSPKNLKGSFLPFGLFLKNLLFTDYFLNHPRFSSLIYNTAFLGSKSWRFNQDALIKGIIAYGIPFRDIDHLSTIKGIEKLEVAFNRLIDDKCYLNKDLTELFYLSSYMASALSFIQKYENYEKRKTFLPFSSGPVASYFFNKTRTVKDAWNAKHELIKIVNTRLKVPYDSLIKKVPTIQESTNFRFIKDIEPCDIMMSIHSRLQKNDLKIYTLLEGWSENSKNELEKHVIYVADKINSGSMTSEESTIIYRLINLESLVN